MLDDGETRIPRRYIIGSAIAAAVVLLIGAVSLKSPAGVVAAVLMGTAVGGVCFQGLVTLAGLREAAQLHAATDHDEARRGAYDAARAVIEVVPVGHGGAPHLETAQFVLEEAKAGFERADTGSDNVEAKATTLISIVAGASSALGVFGISKEGRAIVATPLILLAFFFTAVSLGCLLYIVRSKRFSTPDIEPFISPGIVAEDNRVGIALLLARDYRVSTNSLRRAIRYEPLALFVAYVAIATAAGLVLLNAATGIPWWAGTAAAPSPSPSASASTSPARSSSGSAPAASYSKHKPSPAAASNPNHVASPKPKAAGNRSTP